MDGPYESVLKQNISAYSQTNQQEKQTQPTAKPSHNLPKKNV